MRSLLLTALLALPALALAQGSLTPPGAPAPMMKTLDQLEPRSPLQAGSPGVTVNANGGFTITAPGTYYLTGPLTVASGDGIVIHSSHVALDLNGFSINSTSAAASGSGIIAWDSDYVDIAIRNGSIFGTATQTGGVFSGGGFHDGVVCYAEDTSVDHVAVSAVRAAGIVAKRISACTARVCGMTGLSANVVSDSKAIDCGSVGIACCNATNSFASAVGPSSIGISSFGSVSGCSGTGGATGIGAITIENSCGSSSTSAGLEGSTVTNSRGLSSSGPGIEAEIATGCYATSASDIGLRVSHCATNCYGRTYSGSCGILVREDFLLTGAGSAINCVGENRSGTGLLADTASGCKGLSETGIGLQATSASNCMGKTAGNGIGLSAVTVSGSYGESENNTGLRADASADNCRGVATGTGYGLYSGGNATNCTGKTATGNYGVYVVGAASFCRGDNDAASATKFALHAGIAVACTAETGTIEAAQKFHGTP